MSICIIVQARMTSTRLPGKVLKKVLGKPLLEYQLERLKRVSLADKIIVATTVNAEDDSVAALCRSLSVLCVRGSEEDVLARYYQAAKQFEAQTIIRVTADCPVIDPAVSDGTIRYYLENAQTYDYVSAQNYPRGLDTEVFSFKVLEEAFYKAKAQPDREHVTPYLYRNEGMYSIGRYASSIDYSRYRWTVDTLEDFELIRLIIENLYPVKPDFSIADILDLLEVNPKWVLINSAVKQKQYGD